MTQPFAGVDVCGDRLVARLESGESVLVDASVPLPGTLRLMCRPSGAARVATGGIVQTDTLEDTPAQLTEAAERIVIEGDDVHASWSRDGQGLRFGSYQRFHEPSAATVPFVSGFRPAKTDRAAAWTEVVELDPDCGVYGGGESYQGINLRGRTRRLRNTEVDRAAGRNTAYLNVPLLWSDAGWGLLINTGATITADVAATHSEAMLVEVDDEHLDLFIISGDAMTILRRYHQLTGLPRTMPDWAFGVWMSRSSYFTADEMVSIANELAVAGCPVDVMHVDEWLAETVLDVSAWSAEPDRSRFPHGWTDALGERGIRTSVWINPYVAAGSEIAKRAVAEGFVTVDDHGEPTGTADNPRTLPVDFCSPAARTWWRDRLAATIMDEGIDAVLADFGEELPGNAVLADGSSGANRHNTYGNLYAETVAQAAEHVRGEDFVALCRSGSGGVQRFTAHWAGDLPSTWSGLVSTLRAVLSMSLSGLSTVTCDAGGYWTPESYERAQQARKTMAPGQIDADVDPELFGRWAQWAAFLPLMRFHGVGAREPTAYPEPARSAAIAACVFRKRLQNYVVDAAQVAATTGTPIIRPMVLAYPGDRGARDADLQYLLGDDILVAPIVAPGGMRSLWIPPGHWEPIYGAVPVSGPGWTTVACGIDQFPVWRRA